MTKYRKKPIVIDAEQYHGPGEHIPTLEGEMHVSDGDWIITGVKGERYPCKDDIFRMTYEQVTLGYHDVEEFYKECEHEWVYSNSILLTCPAQQDRVCSKCGETERVTSRPPDWGNDYDVVLKRFRGNKHD